ncbi:helix-turn-helix transcriptional regulator [Dactylosporangium vinaceum]|uniref:XRE family transcriptional regulator n=1 Tax=Dactylosporangium vinaceum TaxID=53362 RepID=A0ABV5M4V0_9ACTN|nr:helix-turn-helix transcriptional regulator [Dactylosporangium vinaceum]UAB96048.1 helix-turn-helix transcriptional regulator [Dactylosporangium vinaceum]
MQPTETPPNRTLAGYLRDLRRHQWPERPQPVTQKQLAEALGGAKPLSVSVISSWERDTDPVTPPEARLAGYARFFATRRSIEQRPARLLDEDELTDEEKAAEEVLHAELGRLRDQLESGGAPAGYTSPQDVLAQGGEIRLNARDTIGGGTWYFGPDPTRIVIVCARLPEDLRAPYAHKSDPDYVRAYTYADADSVIEIFGHLRAVNPIADVRIRTHDKLTADDYHSHLILLGGVDFNPVSREMAQRLDLPVRQHPRTDKDYGGYFEVDGHEYKPVIDEESSGRTLLEDVAYFYRGPSPINVKRTVTLCNGMFGRGTYGAVRALTDRGFRNRNEEYLEKRFGPAESFGILFRVTVMAGETVTPDWTVARNRFLEWPDAG